MFSSNNAASADNQQERLLAIGWVTGFVDGEGCFSVSFIRQPRKGNRAGYKLGVQVWCEFKVTQGLRSVESLEKVKNFFQVGKIYRNARWDNHKEDLLNYSVRNRNELKDVIIPFFQRYPLSTAKRCDFEKFVECFLIINQGRHTTVNGLQEIAAIASQMNRQKDRTEFVRGILNDYTHSSLAEKI